MSLNYDECLNQNPFFKAVQEHHSDIITKATEEDWIICVPRIGTIEPTTISTEDILEHILVPNLDLPTTHFCTLTKQEVVIRDKLIIIKDREAGIPILFDETCYVDKLRKYKLWCIERPLNHCVSDHKAYISIKNLQDCVKLLWRINNSILDDVNKIIQTFLETEIEFDELDVLQEKISALYTNCVEVTLNSRSVPDDNANLAVETYMQHCVHHKLFRAICNCTWQVDASFNKTHRNFSDIQLKDLDIGNEFYENISCAKRELSTINKFTTSLGKIECLRRTVNIFSRKTKTQSLCVTVTADDLLKFFVFLIIKSNLNNWIGNLMYITHFRFCSINLSDENSFLITTLEAAIEYIKTGTIRPKTRLDKNSVINNLNTYFMHVKEGNLEAIQKVFDNNKTNNLFILDKTLQCHPLCSCDKCESVAPFNINSRDDKGCTALHIACLYGQPLIVEYLISKKSLETNALDYSESMPLHYAALKGNQNALLLLLHANAQIDPKDCDGNTPLHLATINGHENCVKALLYFAEQKGLCFNVNFGNNMGDTALHFASKWGYASIANILLQYGAKCNLANKRNQKVFDIVHNTYLKNLLLAAQNQNQQLNILSNTKEKSTEALGVTPKNFHQIKKVDLVLKSIENNDLPLVCYYLGIPTPPPNATELNAKLTCHPLCTCHNCQKQFENTTIPSSKYTHESLNINTCNSEGYSPLHVAAKCGRTEILRLLLDSGALVNVKTYKHQQTPLHLACKNQRVQIVRELLQCGGCDLDVQDSEGNLPLHYACLSNNSRIVELLLSSGNDCNIKNCEGKTPLQEAKGKMLFSIVSLLKGKSESSESSESGSDLFSF